MKNIVVFTYGDSKDPSTWSNVPYLFTTTLEKRGYNVIREDISTNQNLFTLAYSLACKIIKPSTTFYFYRSKINRKIVEKKIKAAVKKYDGIADLYVSISFDFSPSKYTNKKVLLLSDWPIEYAIEKRYNRSPDFLEAGDIRRHKSVIEDATKVISLFQDVALYMNGRFDQQTLYLGGLINALCETDGFEETKDRNYITFIGKKAYYDSAKEVVAAFEKIDEGIKNTRNLELHVIGMNKNDFKEINSSRMFFHGYLNKGEEKQREEYYDILKKSFIIINTNKKWAGMSSVLEAMYYYRPIITSEYDEFIKTFGKNIDFGVYSENDRDEIKTHIEKMLNLDAEEYKKMAESAHLAVKDFSYDCFIEKIEKIVGFS